MRCSLSFVAAVIVLALATVVTTAFEDQEPAYTINVGADVVDKYASSWGDTYMNSLESGFTIDGTSEYLLVGSKPTDDYGHFSIYEWNETTNAYSNHAQSVQGTSSLGGHVSAYQDGSSRFLVQTAGASDRIYWRSTSTNDWSSSMGSTTYASGGSTTCPSDSLYPCGTVHAGPSIGLALQGWPTVTEGDQQGYARMFTCTSETSGCSARDYGFPHGYTGAGYLLGRGRDSTSVKGVSMASGPSLLVPEVTTNYVVVVGAPGNCLQDTDTYASTLDLGGNYDDWRYGGQIDISWFYYGSATTVQRIWPPYANTSDAVDNKFGSSVKMTSDSKVLIVSAPGHKDADNNETVGAFYRYENTGEDTFEYVSGPHYGPVADERFGWSMTIDLADAFRVWVAAPDGQKVYQFYWDASTQDYILQGAFVDSSLEDSGFADGTSVHFNSARQQLYVGAYKNRNHSTYADVGVVHVFTVPESPSNAPTVAPTSEPTEWVPTSAPTTASPTTAEEGCQASILATTMSTMFYLNHERGTMMSWGIDVYGAGTLLGQGPNAGIYNAPPAHVKGDLQAPKHMAKYDMYTDKYLVCAVEGDGSAVYCMGIDYDGFIEGGSAKSYSEFTRVTSVDDDESILTIDEVALGERFMCLTVNNYTAVKCVGLNSSNQLGNGNTVFVKTAPYATPIEINQGDALVRSVVSNVHSSCAVFENNTMACWGLTTYSRFGMMYNALYATMSTPVVIDMGIDGVGIAKLTTNEYINFAVLGTDGVVYSVGKNWNKIITADYSDDVYDWRAVDTSGSDNVNLWTPDRYTMCVKKRGSGEVYCKGPGSYALFGSSSTANHYTVFTLAPYLQDARQVVGNQYNTLVMYINGTVTAFGRNYYRHLQDSDDAIITTPIVYDELYCFPKNVPETNAPTAAPTTSPTIGSTACESKFVANNYGVFKLDTRLNQLWSGGSDQAFGLVSHDTFWWGYTAPYDRMQVLGDATLKRPIDIAVQNMQVCVLDGEDDVLYCWGRNVYGAMGRGYTDGTNFNSPVMTRVLKPGLGLRQVTMTEKATFVLLNDNRTIYTFGTNTDYQMGTATTATTLYDKAYTVNGVTKDIDYIEGNGQNLIVAYTDGTFACSGNTGGLSGLSTATTQIVEVPRWANAKSISILWGRGCFVSAAGKVFCAGSSNAYGQVDPYNVGTAPGSTLVEITELGSDNELVRHYTDFACVVKQKSGDVYCWGRNQNYKLDPTQTTAYITTPLKIQNITGVTQLIGLQNAGAVTTDGQLMLFGVQSEYTPRMLSDYSSFTGNPAMEALAFHDYTCPADGPTTYCGKGDHSVCEGRGYASTFCNMAFGTSSVNGLCTKPVECSTHYDCAPYMYTGRLPYCSSAGICLDKYAGSCTSVKNCDIKVERLSVFSSSVATMSQKLSSGGNSTRMKQAAQNIMDQLATSVNASDSGVDIEIMIDSTETVTLDMSLVNLLGGNKTALLEALQKLACSEDYSDYCSSAWSSSTRRLLLEVRELASEGLIEVSVSYSIDPDTYAALIASGMSFSDGSSFEEALAAALNVTTDDIEVYASDGTIEIAYVVTSEADTEGSPDMTEKITAIQSVNSDLATITSAVTTSLGIDASDIETTEVDLCENRDCNDRGTCNSETGVCTCTTAGYWGVNCETSVSCDNGGTVPFDGTAYCQCSWPYKGLRCGDSVTAEECGTTCTN